MHGMWRAHGMWCVCMECGHGMCSVHLAVIVYELCSILSPATQQPQTSVPTTREVKSDRELLLLGIRGTHGMWSIGALWAVWRIHGAWGVYGTWSILTAHTLMPHTLNNNLVWSARPIILILPTVTLT